jgi:hypothetical protein
MTDLHWTGADSPATVNGAKGRHCTRHSWPGPWKGLMYPNQPIGPTNPYVAEQHCLRCGVLRDSAASRRGMSARRLGGDQERRIERVYGPRKVGEYGDAVDHLGRDFKWQSKATRSLPPKWLAKISEPTWRAELPVSIEHPMQKMGPLGGTRRPLVIRSFVRQGVPTRDWLFFVAWDWWELHMFPVTMPAGYLVIPGADFLEIHGRDSE